jgi:lysozyme
LTKDSSTLTHQSIDYDVAMEVASHEALIRQAYKDSANVLTWCVGMTSATGHSVARYIGNPQPIQHCMNVYVWALRNYSEQVNEAFAGTKLTKAQYAAAVSFHWNTGAIKRASWVKKFKAGDIAGARKAFMNWVTPPEITGRRAAERDLFFDGKWSNNGTMTEFTRLRANMTPDWSSSKRINVSKELKAAFATNETVTVDIAPKPDAKPAAPTLSPRKPSTETETKPQIPVEPVVVHVDPDGSVKPGPSDKPPYIEKKPWYVAVFAILKAIFGVKK